MQYSHANSVVHLPASLTHFPYTAMHEPLHQSHIPISMPVTLSPRYFGVALTPEPTIY